MQTLILRTPEEIASFVARCRPDGEPPHPFCSGAFIRAYFADAGGGARPFVIAVTGEDERLLGLAPWCLVRDRLGLVRLTGIGDKDAWYHDPWIASPGAGPRVRQQLVDALAGTRGEWDYLALRLQPRPNSLVRSLDGLGRVHAAPVPWRQHRAIALESGWEAFWESFSTSFRKSHRRYLRKVEALPHRFYEAPPAALPELLDWVFRLQRERWPNPRHWRAYHAFTAMLCRQAQAEGRLVGHVLELEGETAACLITIRQGDRCFGLLNAHDPRFGQLSPGRLTTVWALEQLARAGARWVDMGPGDQAYKDQLRNAVNETTEAFVAGTWPGRAAAVSLGLVLPALKRQEALRVLYQRARASWTRLMPARQQPAGEGTF